MDFLLRTTVGFPNNWISDGFCDEECNHPDFHYDGGDCCFDIGNINVLFTDL